MVYNYYQGVVKERMSKLAMLTIALLFAATAVLGAFAPVTAQESTEIDVYGNTVDASLGENGSEGWWFDRDQSTSTDYEFTTDKASIGSGSLYVPPIVNDYVSDPPKPGNNKFIAENFVWMPVDELESISYDFLIAGNGDSNDANEFYLNVYANIDDGTNYYDCRYDYVPSSGTTGSFSMAEFMATDIPSEVTKRGTRINACPDTLDGMPAGSHVRMFSISVGDTSTNDEGLAGYLDNVIVKTTSDTTVYDFEKDTVAPAIPTNLHRIAKNGGDLIVCSDVVTRQILYPTWDENTEDDFSHYEYTSINANGAIGINERVLDTNQFVHNWTPPQDGTNGFKVRSVDTNGNVSNWSEVCEITYDSTAPVAEITNPDDGDVLSGLVEITGEVTDENPMNSYFRIEGPDNYVMTSLYSDGRTIHTYNWDTTTVEDGEYNIYFETRDEAGNKVGSRSNPVESVAMITVTVQNNPLNKEDCKKGGFADFGFRNQGLCLQYVNTGRDSR